MKKLFTLVASVFFAATAMAQAEYVDRVINGDAEGDDVSCFWAHDFNVGDNVSARIEVDPLDENNHCFVVTSVGDSGDDWATQFFVRVDPKIEGGDKLRLTMRVRADKAASVGTQAHNEPGDYNYWDMFSNFNVTEEWQTITLTKTVSNNCAYGENNTKDSEGAKEMHSIAFNLFILKEDNNYYFDDISLEVQPAEPSHEFTRWFNLVRNGDLATDNVYNFVGRDGDYGGVETGVDDDGNPTYSSRDLPARIVIDPVESKRALNVRSVAPTYSQENADGNMEDFYVYEDGHETKIEDWQSQFFIKTTHEFQTNHYVKFYMEARADHPATIDSQIHRATPGDYLFYQFVGSFDLTEDWQAFEYEGNITDNQSGGYTIAFNINKYRDTDNQYYFRNIQFCTNEADVTTDTRTLGRSTVYLPVPKDKEAMTEVTVDLSKAVEILEIDNFAKFITSKSLKVNADEKGTSLSYAMSPEDGVYFNDKGAMDEKGGILVELNAEESKDNQASFIITNVGDEYAAGKEVKTRFCFMSGDWYYIYDVTFVDQDKYAALAGIKDVNFARPTAGIIFDLMGRKLAAKPAKGLYILDGQKYIAK